MKSGTAQEQLFLGERQNQHLRVVPVHHGQEEGRKGLFFRGEIHKS